jgi:hypothetical protein
VTLTRRKGQPDLLCLALIVSNAAQVAYEPCKSSVAPQHGLLYKKCKQESLSLTRRSSSESSEDPRYASIVGTLLSA